MVEFPLDPPLAKMLLIGSELGCSSEVRPSLPPPPWVASQQHFTAPAAVAAAARMAVPGLRSSYRRATRRTISTHRAVILSNLCNIFIQTYTHIALEGGLLAL